MARRVLVTGGMGFIGSHVVRHWLTTHPTDEVVNLDALTYAAAPERLADVAGWPNYRFIRGNLTDGDAVEEALDGCELVLHCAAETHVDRSITHGAPFVRTNVEGTYTLLALAQRRGIARFVHVSTDEVYGPVPTGTVDEDAPFAPRSPYASTKAGADLLAQAFRATYGLPVLIVRPTNVFGPWQLPEKFVALAVTRALEGQPIPVYGQGRQRRSWLFVDDACRALIRVATQAEPGAIYNLGSGRELANHELARRILAMVGRSDSLIEFVPDRPGHDARYALDDAKLRRDLNWQPETEFEEGLARTVAWFRTHGEWWRPTVRRLRENSDHWLDRVAGARAHPALREAP